MSSRTHRATLVAVLALLVSLAGAAPAAADGEQPVQLRAHPADQSGPYFDLTLQPGESRRVALVLANNGPEPVRARTYASDGYTIVNGGFGAELRDGTPSGTTGWLTYPTQLLTLGPGDSVERPVVVTVPADAAPGEYLTSVVLENEDPVRGTGSVALDQVVRQAVAVAVRVPGPVTTGLSIGTAGHTDIAGRSVVAVDVANTGTVRLTPVANLVVSDADGAVVSRADVRMDSFYAGTSTKVEITLATGLEEGVYSVDVLLRDAARGAAAEASALAFSVENEPASAAAAASPGQQVVDVLRATAERSPVLASVALLVVFVLLVIGGAVRLLRRSPRHGRHAARHGARSASRRATVSAPSA